MDGQLYASAGIFNGNSTGEGINQPGVDTKQTGIASVRFNPIGKMNPYQEGDLDWTEDAAVSVGAAYAYGNGNNTTGSGALVQDGFNYNAVSVDGNFKYQGWSFHGEFFTTSVNPDAQAHSNPLGFYAQAGYFVLPKELEIAARYDLVDCDDGKAGGDCSGADKINETSATVNYYFWKNSLKAQVGYTHLNERQLNGSGLDDANTNRWIFQLSSYF